MDKQENILREIDVDPYDKQQVKQYLHCDYIDAPKYKIGMKFYRFLVDDNGLDHIVRTSDFIRKCHVPCVA